ncbi:NUDIX hydrolase [Parahaliea mediterranea]|uniref:NUDIX hydrolase n=1 Tax=Parahaliea mediterranea TaxID=651086 RepID=UPI001F4DDBE3|nr:CoA pyrophosphatase [Parahaliea mediterranea]
MSTPSLQRIENRLQHHRPRRKFLRRFMQRSAVAMILGQHQGGPHILMIKRAERKGDPWSGHMAFPGGRMDPVDAHGFAVANRETEEEVGVRLADCARYIGRLSDIRARPRWGVLGLAVSPFVFRLEQEVDFTPNYEVAEVVWVPLALLLNADNRQTMVWERGRLKLTLPCYFYEGRRIWGLSLMMLDELLGLKARERR